MTASVCRFGRQICGDLEAASEREWLVADGLGGYAMGTVAGLRTRRYHGLLLVSGELVSQRNLGLAALDPVLVIGGQRVSLATHEWSGGDVQPTGHRHLASFEILDGVPRWRWAVGGVILQMEIATAHGQPGVAVSFHLLRAPGPVTLELNALCTWRNAHGERRGDSDPIVEHMSSGFVFEGQYRVEGPGYQPGGEWYRNVHYRQEAARGLNANEDLWQAGWFCAELRSGDRTGVRAWVGALDGLLREPVEVISAARARARDLIVAGNPIDDVDEALIVAADQFIVSGANGGSPSVVAGYPWFGDWSRDTMISYEGLFLETNRGNQGRTLLLNAAESLSEGMLANTADTGSLEYNTVDATLWFIHAVGRHVIRTDDLDLAAVLIEALENVIDHHVRGTRYAIGLDPADSLLKQGQAGLALTWMDARIDGVAVTPRLGKPVEINALWISALGTIRELKNRLGQDDIRFPGLEDKARASFRRRFPRPDGSLFDVVDGPSGDDASLRPNQLFAASLPHGPFVEGSVIRSCAPLLTSVGIRSLAPDDPAYIPLHRGGSEQRDEAYHQGTVWPWLLGPYTAAAIAAGIDPEGLLDGLEPHLHEFGLGSVSETADGVAPHAATGAPFQAWSIAETLRARRLVQRTSSRN